MQIQVYYIIISVCTKILYIPNIYYFLVLHNPGGKKGRFIRTRSGRRRVTNMPGTECQVRCRKAFRLDGSFHQVCQHDGKWAGDDKGECIRKSPKKKRGPKHKKQYTI